jgi:Fe-S cluster biogenesis protein NfuA
MFIQTETTPNPATLKFLPGQQVMAEGTLDVTDATAAAEVPLAQALFSIDGISGVFLGPDFISVTKQSGEWQHLKPPILGAIMEHFTEGRPLTTMPTADAPVDEFFDPADRETVDTIKELIESRVRPAVASDGGDIIFKGFRDGTVYLALKGACSGCPSSTATLKNGIQNLLCNYVPEVRAVEQV